MKLPVKYDDINHKQRRLVRLEYEKTQNELCWFCNTKLSDKSSDIRTVQSSLFPSGFFKYPIHLHHDHNTGLTIGAVHNKCNAILWQYYNQ